MNNHELLSIESNLISHPGRKRSNNEDFATFFEPDSLEALRANGSLYIVADGVGGAAHGERASRYAAEKVMYEYYQGSQDPPGERLIRSIRQAGNEIYDFAEREHTRMATTIVAAVVRENILTVASVGDSRAYVISGGSVSQVTQDHTEVAQMVRDGLLTEEESKRAKGKNKLSRSLGGEQDVLVDLYEDIPLVPGDKILLCSDGLTRYARQEDLLSMAGQGSAAEIASRMVDFANQHGGADNISVIVISVGQPFSSSDSTLSIARGSLPHEAVMETIDMFPAPKPLTWQETLTKQPDGWMTRYRVYAPFLVVGVGLFCIFMIVGALVGRRVFFPPALSPTPSPAMTEVPTVGAAVQATLTPTLESTATLTATSAETPMQTATDTATTTQTVSAPTLTQAMTVTTTPTQAPVLEGVCVRKVGDDGALSRVLYRFAIAYDPEAKYHYRECTSANNAFACGVQLEIEDPNIVNPVWWIEIYDAATESYVDKIACDAGGGKWIPK